MFEKEPLIVYLVHNTLGRGELVITSKSPSWGNFGQVPCGAKSAGTLKRNGWSIAERRRLAKSAKFASFVLFLARRWPSMMLGWPAWRGCLGILWCVADLSVALCAPQPSFLARMGSIVHVEKSRDFLVRTTKKAETWLDLIYSIAFLCSWTFWNYDLTQTTGISEVMVFHASRHK